MPSMCYFHRLSILVWPMRISGFDFVFFDIIGE